MTNRYLGLGTGNKLTEVVPAVVGGSASAGMIPALNTSGLFDSSMLPAGTGSVDSVVATAGVALSAGNFVNLYNNAGVVTAQLADCSTGLPADGYVLAAVTAGNTGTVYLNDQNSSAGTALTPATPYYLSTAGGVSTTPPTTAGYISQVVGKSVSATAIQFRPEQPVTLA
ncbi:hypothetical protein [Acidithiobacillus albertensis]|uniref:hypothetical protein n=1 Tax=Acidithiobacillus albertensis TaxID=119978 RepID=UPI00094AD850|nr:hypothetical protein [Acidithiobacillus albertensis]